MDGVEGGQWVEGAPLVEVWVEGVLPQEWVEEVLPEVVWVVEVGCQWVVEEAEGMVEEVSVEVAMVVETIAVAEGTMVVQGEM